MNGTFQEKLDQLTQRYEALINRPNEPDPTWYNGLFQRYRYPVLTAAHTPPFWRYDLTPETNPYLMERMGINAVFNPGAIVLDGKILLVARVEGNDRKSFFAVAESDTGVDGFRFWDTPIAMPEADDPATNVYDMRLTAHEDGWIYGVFCVERKDPDAPPGDMSSAVAQCGIARTHDLKTWERLPDIRTPSPQQRNIVLHAEFVQGRYAFYTRPQDEFISAGSGGGIGWGLCADITDPEIEGEIIIDSRDYHTIKELKNGAGAPPIKTPAGWLHIAHGVRANAAGLRYVLYALLCDLDEPWRVTHRPGGYLIAPQGEERVGDVSDVVFCNGVVARASVAVGNGGGDDDSDVFIYYASSDTRTHVATTTVDKLVDYALNTPEDGLCSSACVAQRMTLIQKNLSRSRT